MKTVDVEGIGPAYAKTLAEKANINTTEQLLEAGATRKGRQELVEKTGISNKLILRWINMADLFRIKGIGAEYADLLEAAGVDTVKELAQRVPQNLHAALVETNEKKKLVRRVPNQEMVADWVQQAKSLPPKIEY